MNRASAKKLVDKCMRVIISCENQEQLNSAVKYSGFAYKILAREMGLIHNMNFITLIERSVGYAQCNINNAPQTDIPGDHK